MATGALSTQLAVCVLITLCMALTYAQGTNGTCNGIPGLCAVPLSLVSFAGTHNSAAYDMQVKTKVIDLGALPGSDLWENQDVGIRTSLEAGIRALDMDATYLRVSEEEALAIGDAVLGAGASLDEIVSLLGARSSDGGVCVATWAHCSNDDICAFSKSNNRADTIPLATFDSVGGFLDAKQDAVIVLGLSDLFAGPWRDVCPGTEDLKRTIMRSLGRSGLFRHVARQIFMPNATVQAVIDSGHRALVIAYDGWGRDARYEITGSDGVSKAAVGSQLFQRLTAASTPDGLNDVGTVRRQMAQELLPRVSQVIGPDTQKGLPVDTLRVLSYSPNQCQYCTSEIISGIQNIGSDVINKVVEGTKDAATTVYDGAQNVAQDAANAVSGGVNTAIDKVQDVAGTIGQGAGDAVDKVKDFLGGLFGRKLLADAATCGYIACAPASNEKAHLLYILYKASTTGVQDTTGLVPRFNVFQVNYFDVPVEGVVQTVQQLNKAWAAQYTAQKGEVDGPLTTCAWVADNSEFKAQIVCLDHGIKNMGLDNVQEAFLPKDLALVGVRDGQEVGSLCGGAKGSRVSAESLQSAFGGSIDAMRVKTC